MSKNIYYLSLLLCMVFVSNAMEQIEEVLSPAVRRGLESGARSKPRSEQLALTDRAYIDKRMLAMQARQRLAAAQDSHILESMQAMQGFACAPSGQEQEVDWQLAVEGDTELHTAIRKKDDDSIHILLLHSQGAGINTCNTLGDTPLLLASQTGSSKHYIHKLFRYPIDVNVKNAAGFTALYYAIKKNDDCCMEMLLKHCADASFFDEDGNTLLHTAAQSDAFFSVGHLARYKLNPNQLNKYNLAPLHIAILKNFEHTAHSLLWETGANPNTPMAGESPLIFAIRNELPAIIRELVAKGADANAKDAMGNSALYLALTRRDNISIMSQLLEHGINPEAKDANGDTLLASALKNNDIAAARTLIEHGANPNAPDANGDTPLTRALKNNDTDAARTLIEGRANPNIPDANGVMPIFLALQHKNLDCATYLLRHDADPDIKDAEGNTPLTRALKNNDTCAVRTLIEGGANPNIPDINGDTPLASALKNNDTCAVRTLIEGGANPNIPDINGDTPLALALKNNDTCATFTLIVAGANPNIQDANGVMPIFHILRLNNLTCAAHLVKKGADPNVRDAEGNTPLHLAVQFENLVSLLIYHGAHIDAVNIHGDTPLHCVESMTPISSYVLRLYGADINQKNNEGLTPYDKAIRYCQNVRMLDPRLLSIIEPAGSHGLLGWLSSEQPKTTALASARDYGITLANLPGIQAEDARSSSFIVPGQDSRIEPLDDKGSQAATAAQDPEEHERDQEKQPRDNGLTGNVCTGWQIGTKFLKGAVSFLCPWAKQSHGNVQPKSSSGPEAVSLDGASASSAGAHPKGSTGSLLNFDDPPIKQPADNNVVSRQQRFFVESQS